MDKIPIFKKEHFYLYKSSGLLVLCLEDHPGREINGDTGWTGRVMMTVSNGWTIGQLHNDFNLSPNNWIDLGLDE
jgi:hypothetical protein